MGTGTRLAGALGALALGLALGASPSAWSHPTIGEDHDVAMTDADKFVPATVTIAVGSRVTWTNEGASRIHNVRSEDFQGSGDCPPPFVAPGCVVPGEAFTSDPFPTVGTYEYDCQVHGAVMTGKVVVEDPTSNPSPTQSATPSGSPSRTKKASPSASASAPSSATATPTTTVTASASPTLGVEPSPEETETADGQVTGANDTGSDAGGRGALATLAVLALAGAGFLVWRRMITMR